MQTFLPYANVSKTAETLDYRRLGKQRVEAWQILNALIGKSKGWTNHPAVHMWKGYEPALSLYGWSMCFEWILRGYKDSMLLRFNAPMLGKIVFPPWFNNESFHASHRSNLLRKDPIYYGKFGWTEPDNLPYVWPVAKT
jgi:hypothetical protein